MSFSIILRNDGDTATIRVYQKINNNEAAELHNGKVETGGLVSLKALKTEDDDDRGGDFAWEHDGSGLSGEEYVNAGDELRVR